MEVVAALRLLWRRRIRVGIGAVLALAVAVAVGRSPVPASGLAKTRVVVDTPRSQLVTGAPRGADTLYWRATLLAMRLGTDAARQQLARETQVPADKIAVTDVELTAPSVPASLPTAAVQAATVTPEPYVLTVDTNDVLPIVSIETTAPDRVGATRLAEAAVHALQAGASPGDTAAAQGLSIQQVSPIVARVIPGGPGRMKMALVAVVVFGLWCLCLLVGPAVAGAQRTIREASAAGFWVRGSQDRAPRDR
jgi:hypothetical protein